MFLNFVLRSCFAHCLVLRFLEIWSDVGYLYCCSFYGEDIPIKELCDRVAHYVHLCTLYWWLRFDFLLFSLVRGKVHGTAFASLCTNGLSETAEDHETRGYKTKNCDQDGISHNVFWC